MVKVARMSLRSHLRLAAQLQLLPVLESGQETLVGGQAVMEGVMMRAPHSYCIAVRRATGEIVTQESPIARMSEMYPIFKLPILRGVATLGQAMSLGIKSFQFSANVALADENKKEGAPEEAKIPAWAMSLQLIISLAFFLGMYKMLPAFLTQQVIALQPALHNALLFSLVEGIIRLALFIPLLSPL